MAIYQLNEPGRFPPGVLEEFSRSLRDDACLTLVCEAGGEVRAVGSICRYPQDLEIAWLSFGMVHPDYHRHGFGTVSLLARLVSLGSPVVRWSNWIATVGGSETFYRRFGFAHMGYCMDESERSYRNYRMRLYPADWEICRKVLEHSGVVLDLGGIAVPVRKGNDDTDAGAGADPAVELQAGG